MKLLLDTHVFLWYLVDSRKLSKRARQVIDRAHEVYISAASIWEVAIKIEVGKVDVEVDGLIAGVAASDFRDLPVRSEHAVRVATLPPIHEDPFDRLLVAQAMVEPLNFLTADELLVEYSSLVILT